VQILPRALLSACAALLFACAASDRAVDKTYFGRSFAGKTMALVYADTARVTALNPGDVYAAFPRENPPPAKAILAQEFADAFSSSLEGYLDYVRPVRVPDSAGTAPADQRIAFRRESALGAPGFDFTLPSREWLKSRGVDADLVLCVNSLKSAVTQTELIAPKLGGTIEQTSLTLEGWYIIWDYAGNKPIAQGRFRPDIAYTRAPDGRDWMKVFDKAAQMVVETSPFKGPKWMKL
jgi:hypothetical protein